MVSGHGSICEGAHKLLWLSGSVPTTSVLAWVPQKTELEARAYVEGPYSEVSQGTGAREWRGKSQDEGLLSKQPALAMKCTGSLDPHLPRGHLSNGDSRTSAREKEGLICGPLSPLGGSSAPLGANSPPRPCHVCVHGVPRDFHISY